MRCLIAFLLAMTLGQVAAAEVPCRVQDVRVIDSDFIPEYHFTGQESPQDLLSVYCLGADTWLFMGSIEQLSTTNRGFNGNAGFVVTPEGVVVIDVLGTPLLGKRMIATIRSVTDQPIRYVVITHNHPDHYYGIAAFQDLPGVRIIAHQGLGRYLASPQFMQSVDYRREILPGDMDGFKAVEPNMPVSLQPDEALSFELGGKHFEVFNTGTHHSDGDLLVYQADDGIVWASDLVFNQRVTFIGDGNSEQALAGLEWLSHHFEKAVLMVPGHGSAQTPPFPMLERTQDYLERLRAVMTQAIENDVDLSDALEQAEFEDWRGVRLYKQNHRANASFIYRELEQELF